MNMNRLMCQMFKQMPTRPFKRCQVSAMLHPRQAESEKLLTYH